MLKRLFPKPLVGLAAIGLFFLAATSFAQDNVITERMKKDIFFLASPECEGRGVGSKGIDVAADYIVNNIKQAGLKPGGKNGTYFQPFVMKKGGKGGVKGGTSTLSVKGPTGQTVELQFDKDFQVLPGLA